jgi:hypothetical protein
MVVYIMLCVVHDRAPGLPPVEHVGVRGEGGDVITCLPLVRLPPLAKS